MHDSLGIAGAFSQIIIVLACPIAAGCKDRGMGAVSDACGLATGEILSVPIEVAR